MCFGSNELDVQIATSGKIVIGSVDKVAIFIKKNIALYFGIFA